ncbi:hypothetical protein U1Q18_017105 [Sarracenia purpurea var. burkii]
MSTDLHLRFRLRIRYREAQREILQSCVLGGMDMASYVGILASDQWLQNQFPQVELRRLKSHFAMMRRENGRLTLDNLSTKISKLKHGLRTSLKESVILRRVPSWRKGRETAPT